MSERLCAVSVDLDEVPNYHAIHGLPPPGPRDAHAVYDVALPRLGQLALDLGIPLTFFAVGQDLARRENAAALRALADAGHEVGNHTFGHRYDLTRLAADDVRDELAQGAEAIERAVGRRPLGARAPGYTVTDAYFDALEALGALYDSSVFPSPPYYAAKLAAMTAIRLRGRHSRSIVDDPRVLTAPTRPYRPGRPYHRRGGRPLVELPIQVTRGARLPFIGTTVTLAGASVARALVAAVVGEPLVNLELHGIDVLDAGDGLGALAPHQRDVRVPGHRKMEALGGVVAALRAAGYRFVTLAEAARLFGARL